MILVILINIFIDILAGFGENKNTLNKCFIAKIAECMSKISEKDENNGISSKAALSAFTRQNKFKKYVLKVLKESKPYKDELFATALYLNTIYEYTPIFDGMEYTPILVNLFKGLEELICDLLLKLEIKEIKVRDEYVETEKCSLGNYKYEIERINKDDKYNQYLRDYLECEKSTLMKNITSNDKVKYWKKIENMNAAEFLNQFLLYFIDKCRNGKLHKNNINDTAECKKVFDNSLHLIGLICEWYSIRSNHMNINK